MKDFNRATFLAGSLAAAGALFPSAAESATPPAPSGVPPERLLGRLMAGNQRFVDNDFPPTNTLQTKRELLKSSQAPFAAILACADSRVVPNLIFVQGIGDLFVARVAGNCPDDYVIASLEYAVEHLGTRLIMVLGHEGCGAVAAVYEALQTKKPLPPHLFEIQELMGPGIESVVQARGTQEAAVEANVRAGIATLKASHPVIAESVESGRVLVAGGYYHLVSGEVSLVD
ncbi:MAG TPA: carbonic anhydrase [Candidatus Babeliales bacterium]|nr:carbonic anhydrase [Candidatus Babeliales bacterium]